MKSLGLLLLTITSCFTSFAQKIELDGTYQGNNIFIQNPSTDEGQFCTEKVLVNKKEVFFKKEPAFMIALDSMNFKKDDPVFIEIYHKDGCKPKVLTNNYCFPKPTFDIVSISIDTAAVLHWTAKNEINKLPYTIEQFKWNKWVKAGEVDGKGGSGENEYSFQTRPHSGKNQFRVKQFSYSSGPRLSKTVQFVSKSELNMSRRLTNNIEFDAETDYEIYDSDGNLIKKGRTNCIHLSEFKRGSYYLNYDNKMGEFKVK